MITEEEFRNLKHGDKVLLVCKRPKSWREAEEIPKVMELLGKIVEINCTDTVLDNFEISELLGWDLGKNAIEKITSKKSIQRISKNEYYLNIAKAVSKRSTCLRRKYGAVIVKNDRIISTGYNGSAMGEENCCDIGSCYRERNNIPHGEQYEKCVAVHAEQNAISSGNGQEIIGSTLYLYGEENGQEIEAEPCLMCKRLIINAQIVNVISSGGKENYNVSL